MVSRILQLLCILALLTPAHAQIVAYMAIVKKDGSANAMQFVDACVTNIKQSNRKALNPIVAAIRYSENGKAGKEFGILHKRCPNTFRGQAGWCAATVQKNYDRWLRTKPKECTTQEFIVFLGARYCPIGAKNDPTNLNKNWVRNVTYFYSKFYSITPSK